MIKEVILAYKSYFCQQFSYLSYGNYLQMLLVSDKFTKLLQMGEVPKTVTAIKR